MSESSSLKRLRFFTGRLLTAADFTLDQNYLREKLKRHNRSLHGFGIVSGLEVSASAGQISVAPGIALDCEGNEIVVCEKQVLSALAAVESWHAAYVNIRFAEEEGDFIPVVGDDAETSAPSTLRQSFEIILAQENCNRGHRDVRARWQACGKPHALTIAKLRRGAEAWRVDRRYRALAIK